MTTQTTTTTTEAATMRVIHYTADLDLYYDEAALPRAIDTVESAGLGRGIWVYPESAAMEWQSRRPTTWEIDAKYVHEYQRFSASDSGVGHEVIECFIRAEDFDKLRRI